jgi:hypothetical protein
MNCEILDINNCKNNEHINLIKNEFHFINPNYEYHNGNINISNTMNNNDNKIYTKLDAKTGKHDMKILLNNLGTAKINLSIKSYIEVAGPIFGDNKKSLFYYRNISRENPMPNYQSKIWINNMHILKNETNTFKTINLSSELKLKMGLPQDIVFIH